MNEQVMCHVDGLYTGCSGELELPDDSPCFRVNDDNVLPAQCSVVTFGTGDIGQLGLGPNTVATISATRVPRLSDVVQVAVGGMHTVCLDVRGKVMQLYGTSVCLSACLLDRVAPLSSKRPLLSVEVSVCLSVILILSGVLARSTTSG